MLTHRCNRFVVPTGMRHHTTEHPGGDARAALPAVVAGAALRWLIHWAPLDITSGRPYLQRRRYVRQHYHVAATNPN